MKPMTDLLTHGIVVLDGGLSNALEDRGHDLSSDLWTARLLRDDPGEIVAVHRSYFAAGGTLILVGLQLSTWFVLLTMVDELTSRPGRTVRDLKGKDVGAREPLS